MPDWKRNSLAALAVFFLALAFPQGLPAAETVKSPAAPAAIVNGHPIPAVLLEMEMDRISQRQGISPGALPPEQVQVVREQALNTLINRELLYQESLKAGIAIETTAVEKAMEQLQTRFGSAAEYQAALEKMKLTEAALRSLIEHNMAVQRLVEERLVKKITVDGKEAKAFYDAHPDMFRRPEQVRASHILIKIGAQASAEEKKEAQDQLRQLEKRLQKGEDFGSLAKEFSQGPSAAKGGDLGFFSRGEMVPSFEEAAFKLEPGEVSDIVETPYGYHLIKVTEKRPAETVAYEEIEERLRQYLQQEKVQQELVALVKSLREQAEIQIPAAK